jgi:hypothetical protein
MRLQLKLHSDCISDAAHDIEVAVGRPAEGALSLDYYVSGRPADLRLPDLAAPARADGLWQHTCFEAFVRPRGSEAYFEFNFAPSRRWAAYAFDRYRSGMAELEIEPSYIGRLDLADRHLLSVILPLPAAPPLDLALSAVIEERSGRKSYWALAHPPGKADFHHPDSFVHEIS